VSTPAPVTMTNLTGRYVTPAGEPLKGSVVFTPPMVLTLPNSDTISQCSATVKLDERGQFSVFLISTDNPGMSPYGWTYKVMEKIDGCPIRQYYIFLPAVPQVVDISKLAPVSPYSGQYLPVVGPPGPPGRPTVVNGKSGDSITLNAADVGANALNYLGTVLVPASPPPLVDQVLKATSATAAAWATISASPSGAASGDLSGTYPGPTVSKIKGITVLNDPGAGQVLVTSQGPVVSTASWSAIPASPPSGDLPADSDLTGQYPNPTVKSLQGIMLGPMSAAVAGQVLQIKDTGGGVLRGQFAALAGLPPTGAAGGDLKGTYPDPGINKINGATLTAGGAPVNSVLTVGAPGLAGWIAPPTASTSQAGYVQLADLATDIKPLGAAAAGTSTKAPAADHVHAMPRLDQVGAPTAAVALNAQKITGVANGTAATDGAAFGQIPVKGTTAGTFAEGNDTRFTFFRRRDIPDQVVAESVYAGTAPVITTAVGTTPTPGYIKYAPPGVTTAGTDVVGPYAYAGAGNFQIGTVAPDPSYVLPLSKYPNTYASGQSAWSVEFGTDAAIFQVRMKYISAATMYRLSIDGRVVTNDLMKSSGGTTAGSGHLITIDLGTAAPRRIRLDFSTFPFGGVYLPPTASMWRVALTGGRFMTLTDSIGDGSAQSLGGGCGTWTDRVARMLGCTDQWRQGRGGTGYITPGSFATFGTRLNADVIAWAPTRLIVAGGYNDNQGSQAAIKSAADSLYAAIRAGLPACEVYIIGCWSPTGTPAASIVSTDDTLRTAAATAKYPFISSLTGNCYDAAGVVVATHGQWITGTGNTSAPTGSGNADLYIGPDAVHPNDAGHIYLSRRVIASLRELMPA
jgi:lysophospholipase L1-like esterase